MRDVTRAACARQIGVVLQEPFLFSGTIADNIRYGRPDATRRRGRGRRAARSDAHDFIARCRDGYDTPLGERGAQLSRRASASSSPSPAPLLADPRILILDEATANVDTRTEALIQQAWTRCWPGRTSFVIAHRLSTIRNADQVLVLTDGRIVERGTHDELLARGGVYADLYRRQFGEMEAAGKA